MTNSNSDSGAKTGSGKLQLSKTLDMSRTVGAPGASRGKAVTVEVRRARPVGGRGSNAAVVEVKRRPGVAGGGHTDAGEDAGSSLGGLSAGEREARMQALKQAEVDSKRREEEEVLRREDEVKRQAEDAKRRAVEVEEAKILEAQELASGVKRDKSKDVKAPVKAKEPEAPLVPAADKVDTHKNHPKPIKTLKTEGEDESAKPGKIRLRQEPRRTPRLTVTQAMDFGEERMRSLAQLKRQRDKAKRHDEIAGQEKIVREVVLPESITVQELANRMAERAVDVVKELMKLGTMATPSQVIDADTAELVITEFGHKLKRVTDADVENVLRDAASDTEEQLVSRPPVVTIMGHVDHGKTSLLDALRKTDVAAGEAGGITQHIGAYQIAMGSGNKITFLDTPGHEAFTAMRLRGAKVTDIVVLVVAADDGVREQTIEALNHARAAEVPIIVAINKIDKPGADPMRVKTELLQHEIVVEDMGGETIAVEVSAKAGTGLDKLEEAIALQAEIMELKANPARAAVGAVIEAKVDKGRGSLATLLVQRGTLRIGDIVVAGAAYGRVRAILNDKGQNIEIAGPALPVEILGLDSAPEAGDEFAVVESEKIARDISEYRAKKSREMRSAAKAQTLEQLFTAASGQKIKELPVIIKGDVQGSVEAIIGSITKYSGSEVAVRVLHSGVGAVTESDISLAQASGALIVAFNVRANNQARDLAKQEGVEVRLYSVIYNVVDDVKAALSGMLSPDKRETITGYARIDEVFNITKVGKVAGCVATEGVIKRGCKVRLLRDNVVIHDGALKTLKRFKDEVKEVKNGQECGMAFESYEDIRAGDMIEAYEVEEVARTVQ